MRISRRYKRYKRSIKKIQSGNSSKVSSKTKHKLLKMSESRVKRGLQPFVRRCGYNIY